MPGTNNSTYEDLYPGFNIADSVFGPAPAPQPGVEITPAQQAEQEVITSFQDMLKAKKQSIEQQRTADTRMARVNALGNLLTTMVQPIGWAIGGKGFGGVTGGVQPVDNRQYLEAFNRAVKANEDLRNIGSMEDEFKFKMAQDKYNREVSFEQHERMRKLDAELGVSKGKTGAALDEERKTKAIDAWTIHNNGMTLFQYISTINATFPGFFGEGWTPNKEELDRIEAEIKKNKPATQAIKKESGSGKKGDGNKPEFNIGGNKADVTLA